MGAGKRAPTDFYALGFRVWELNAPLKGDAILESTGRLGPDHYSYAATSTRHVRGFSEPLPAPEFLGQSSVLRWPVYNHTQRTQLSIVIQIKLLVS